MKALPAYLIHGAEGTLVAQELKSLIDKLLPENQRALSLEEPDVATELTPSQLIDNLNTPPLFSNKRVVVLREVEKFSKDLVDAIISYLKNYSQSTTLILVFEGAKVPKHLISAVREIGEEIEIKSGNKKDEIDYIKDKIRSHGLKFEEEALEQLIDYLTSDLSPLEGILQILVANAETGKLITREMLAKYLTQLGGGNPWDLLEAIDSGNSRKAISVLQRLLHGGNRHPLAILSMLFKNYELIFRVNSIEHLSSDQISQQLRISPYRAKLIKERAANLGYDHIVRVINLLSEADINLRGASGIQNSLVLEVLVARLCQISRLTKPAPQKTKTRQSRKLKSR